MAIAGRRLIPEHLCIVVLDASAARELAQDETTPDWVDTFSEMSGKGYSFSLANGAFGRLLDQRLNERKAHSGFERMIAALECFLNPALPVLPARRDIEAMVGAAGAGASWEEEVLTLSAQAWTTLRDAYPQVLRRETDALRESHAFWTNWIRLFNGLEEAWQALEHPAELDKSKRDQLDKALVAVKRGKATAAGLSNNGTDTGLIDYLQLPALITTEDLEGIMAMEAIPCFQKAWFFKPGRLASAWINGEAPRPRMPDAPDAMGAVH